MPYGADIEAKPIGKAPQGAAGAAQQGFGAHDAPVTGPSGPRSDTLTMAPEPSDTVGGYLGATTRALTPTATGAAIGGMIGGPPGAAIGTVAMGGTQAILGIYNLLAPQMGLPTTVTPQDATDWVLDHLGVKRAETPGERMWEAGVGGAVGGGGVAKAAKTVAETGIPSATRFLRGIGTRPGTQAVSGAIGGEAGQYAREQGASPLESFAVSLPFTLMAPGGRRALPGQPSRAAVAAHEAGYVVHPGEISEQPGGVSQVASATGGKIKTWQEASARNQHNTNNIAAKELGQPEGTVLTDEVFDRVRNEAGQVFEEVANSTPVISTVRAPPGIGHNQQPISPLSPAQPMIYDPVFAQDVRDLAGISAEARHEFPHTMQNTGIEALERELSKMAFSPRAAVDYIRTLRHESQMNFLARDDPKKFFLARAQRRAAEAVEDLMDRQLERIGQPGLVDRWRQARTMIAKSYDIQTSMIGTDVNARRVAALGQMSRHGARPRQLTEGLKTIADTFNGFPKNLAVPHGPAENLSVLDMYAAVASALSGHPAAAAAVMLRPTARRMTLSPWYQNWQVRGGQRIGGPTGRGGLKRSTLNPIGVTAGQAGDLSSYYDGDSGYDAITQGQQ